MLFPTDWYSPCKQISECSPGPVDVSKPLLCTFIFSLPGTQDGVWHLAMCFLRGLAYQSRFWRLGSEQPFWWTWGWSWSQALPGRGSMIFHGDSVRNKIRPRKHWVVLMGFPWGSHIMGISEDIITAITCSWLAIPHRNKPAAIKQKCSQLLAWTQAGWAIHICKPNRTHSIGDVWIPPISVEFGDCFYWAVLRSYPFVMFLSELSTSKTMGFPIVGSSMNHIFDHG